MFDDALFRVCFCFCFCEVPGEYYQERERQEKLVDLVLLDLQDNRLVNLPDDFLALMPSLRKLSLAKNRCSLFCTVRLPAPLVTQQPLIQ